MQDSPQCRRYPLRGCRYRRCRSSQPGFPSHRFRPDFSGHPCSHLRCPNRNTPAMHARRSLLPLHCRSMRPKPPLPLCRAAPCPRSNSARRLHQSSCRLPPPALSLHPLPARASWARSPLSQRFPAATPSRWSPCPCPFRRKHSRPAQHPESKPPTLPFS